MKPQPLPGDYARLAADQSAQWGYKPVAADATWRLYLASRYIRMMQSRRSLLTWKVFGKRMDGWTNADHPTESVPGDLTTLPAGADPNRADLDYVGTCPAAQRVTEEEKMTIARWIDLGAPINLGPYGWFLDDLKPTVHVDVPRAGAMTEALTRIRFGLADANSGVDLATLSVLGSFEIGCQTPVKQLASQAVEVDDGIYEIQLPSSVRNATGGWVNVSVKDRQGNVTRVQRTFGSAAARSVSRAEAESVEASASEEETHSLSARKKRRPKYKRTPTPIAGATKTPWWTKTKRPTSSPTRTRTPIASGPTRTGTPNAALTATRTPTVKASRTATRTATPTRTRMATRTRTATATATPTPTRKATATPTPTRTTTPGVAPLGPSPTPALSPCAS
jgi:hypothetical protein